jgi:DNA repair protein RecN (Recombination protein N)
MELESAVFEVQIQPRCGEGSELDLGSAGPNGVDEVEFLWSANKGERLRALHKTASGGELSRLMLAVKHVLCSHDLVSLYVFDEVDTGLGGKAADSIGRKIQTVAVGHQAITITHLASIAARADHHIFVTKETLGARTVSALTPIEGNVRVQEIARMIDGAPENEATLAAARDLLKRAMRGMAA